MINEVSIVKKILRQYDYFDSQWNKGGKGNLHLYEIREKDGQTIVIDHVPGLIWQQTGSSGEMNYKNAQAYIDELNAKKIAGYNDWHLPTLEEAMSLMEHEKRNANLYIDPVFDEKQWGLWTADTYSASLAWGVDFSHGVCNHFHVDVFNYFVRAVRSRES